MFKGLSISIFQKYYILVKRVSYYFGKIESRLRICDYPILVTTVGTDYLNYHGFCGLFEFF